METILTLLFILLPVIFKLIGKKFEQAGQPEKAEKVREIMKTLGGDADEGEDPFSGLFGTGREPEPEPEYVRDEPVDEVKPVPQTVPVYEYAEYVERQTAPKPQAAPKKPILEEEVKTKSGEKIDPKKLVIYSEIMKPKYTE